MNNLPTVSTAAALHSPMGPVCEIPSSGVAILSTTTELNAVGQVVSPLLAPSSPMVSMVSDAMEIATQDIDIFSVLTSIRGGKWRTQVERIRGEWRKAVAEGRNPKDAVAALKKALPGVLWSGQFTTRDKKVPLAKKFVRHSGILCADLDHLDGKLEQVHANLNISPYLLAMFVSPTGTGIKALFRVKPDVSLHYGSFLAVQDHVRVLAGVEVDESCKDPTRLCFVSYDPQTEVNLGAEELQPLPEKKMKAKTVTAAILPGTRREIAEHILGSITWTSDTEGFCGCPGQHRHTSANGERDCQIRLDGAPTLTCFHNSCRGILDGVNHELRSKIGKIEAPLRDRPERSPFDDEEPEPAARVLPEIEDMATALERPEPTPAVIVEGILHAGTKFVVGGGSKSFKTWVLLDQAVSVATGSPWWGFPTHQGRVLYVNMEIHRSFFAKRLATIMEAKGVTIQPGQLDHWPLRGHAVGIEMLLPEILRRVSKDKYALVVLDPIYKLYGGRDENGAGDVANLLNALERIAVQSGAAICFGSHFAKGNASGKEAIDRISGSGVFARDPDSILTMTRHEQDGVFAVDPILRNFPPVSPFCVRWEYPLMARTDANPELLKRAAGRPSRYRIEDILSCFDGDASLTLKDWLNSAKQKHGIGATKFYELKAEAVKNKQVRQSKVDDLWHLLR